MFNTTRATIYMARRHMGEGGMDRSSIARHTLKSKSADHIDNMIAKLKE